MDQQDEAREFLASRRARLTPAAVGLPPSIGRRRVPGLRRDEVAALAGLSSEDYAHLERGNLARASDAALDALARALRLDEAEQLHLRNLAHAARVPARQRRTSGRSAPVAPVHVSMQRILDALTTVPAYVRDGRIDMVAANTLARELHSPVFAFARATGTLPNTARFAFLDPAGRHFYPDWDQVTRDVVAALHAAAGHNPYHRPLTDLIGELSTRSDTFRALWADHNVGLHRTGTKRMRHPDVGLLELDYDVMEPLGEPDRTLIAYTAAPGTPTADKLALLATLAATRTAAHATQTQLTNRFVVHDFDDADGWEIGWGCGQRHPHPPAPPIAGRS